MVPIMETKRKIRTLELLAAQRKILLKLMVKANLYTGQSQAFRNKIS